MRKQIWLILITLFISVANAQNAGDQFSYALKLYNEGFYDLASQQFSNYISSNPTGSQVPEAHYLLGKCYVHLNKPELAIIELKKLALDFPQHEKAPLAWFEIGQLQLKNGNPEEAAKAFENVKILYPSNPLASKSLLEAGKVRLEQNNLEDGFRIFTELLGRYSETPEALMAQIFLSEIEQERGNISNAIRLLEKLSTVKADSVKNLAMIKLAKIHLKAGNLLTAKELLDKVTAPYRNQEYAELYLKLLWKNRKFDQSIQFLQNNASLFKSPEQYERLLSVSYARAGKPGKAVQVLDKEQTDQINIILLNTYAARTGNSELILKNLPKIKDMKIRDKILEIAGRFLLEKGDPESFLKIIDHVTAKGNEKITNEELISLIVKAIFMDSKTSPGKYLQFLNQSSSGSIRDDLAFLDVLNAYRNQKYQRFIQYSSIFAEKYPYSEYFPEVKKLRERVQFNYVSSENISFEDYLDILISLIENSDLSSKYLQISTLYLKNTRNFKKANRFAAKASHSEDEQIRLQALDNLVHGYIGLFRQTNEKSFLDSAALYLKQYMDTAPQSEAGVTLLLDFFENSLPFIKPDVKRRKATREKLQSLMNQALQSVKGRIEYLYFMLSSPDSQYVMLKQSRLNEPDHYDEILAKGIEISRQKEDTTLFVQLNLKLIREFGQSYYARFAVRNLMDYYAGKNDFDSWYQIYQFYSRNMNYCEDLFSVEQYAEYLLQKGNIEELEKIYHEKYPLRGLDPLLLNELYPDYALFQFYLGKGLYLKDDYEKAIEFFGKYLEGNSNDDARRDDVLKILAQIFIEKGNDENAIWYLEQYSGRNENPGELARVKLQLCSIYNDRKMYDQLFALTRDLMSGTNLSLPNRYQFEYYNLLAQIYMDKITTRSPVFAQFEKKYRKNNEVKPYISELYLAFAQHERVKKNFKTAHKMIDRANKYADARLKQKTLYLRGYLYTIQNEHEKALKILTEFPEKYPDSPYLCKVYNTLGNLFYRMEKKRESLEMYNKALEVAKETSDIKLTLNNLIVLNKELGFWDGVLRASREYISKFPDDAGNMDKQILIGLSYSRLNQFEEAIRYLRKIKPYVPADREPEVQFYIGEAYFNSGRYEEAIAEFLKIPMFSKKTKLQWEASAFYFAGQAYERLGKKDEAIKMYREIIKRPGILWDLKKEAQKRIDQIR